MAYLLHLDTSVDAGMVAVSRDGVLLAHRVNEQARNHAATINIMINDLLTEIQIFMGEIDAIAVCAGPGSYTGLRIALATAKGLSYALEKPLMLDNKLTLLAYQYYMKYGEGYDQYISLIIAREKEYFISIYDHAFACTLNPMHVEKDKLQELIEPEKSAFCVTDDPAAFKELGLKNLYVEENIKIDLESWAFYAFGQYKCNKFVNLLTSEPFYLKQVYTHK